MNNQALILLPNQLFLSDMVINFKGDVYLLEEALFFKQFNFHQMKLVFHRASMKSYFDSLRSSRSNVYYISSKGEAIQVKDFIQSLQDISSLTMYDPVDYCISKLVNEACSQQKIDLHLIDNPSFLNTSEEINLKVNSNPKRLLMANFYKNERIERNILIQDGKPKGGKWSYDAENRKKYPKQKTPPFVSFEQINDYYEEAIEYVNKYYSNNLGEVNKQFLLPIDHDSSNQWLTQFLETRFDLFGIYEDAISSTHTILHHSLLSPLMNVGLLVPDQIIKVTLVFANQRNIPLNSLEGFIRQILGWREFIRGVYQSHGSKQRTTNFWKFSRKMPTSFYKGETGILPVDDAIKNLLKTGYNHHIERLMIIGNFMLLCEVHPDEVYQWFMELYIDAYDWVMVPNVYGMSQFADGGLFATKPYISGSNYILKMSDYKKGDWCKIWDALYWRFIDKHSDFFQSQPRLSLMINLWNKKEESVKSQLIETAEKYLKSL